jgi:pimeloyl-ACP methyl ester carboxylesterase
LRGTALSSPILYDQDLFVDRVSELPTDGDEFVALVAKNVALRKSSMKLTGTSLIDYMDTATIAQDHEMVRSALGNEKLSWLGQSGGTLLGMRYAEMYPNNIRAMVLDAVAAQSQVGTPGFIENAVSEDAVMRQFFKWCEQQNATTCPLAHQNQTAEAIWTSLSTQAQTTPLPAPGCTPKTCVNNNVTADDLRNVARQFLYKPHLADKGFAALAAGVYEVVLHNDATGVAQAVLTVPNNSTPPFVTAVSYATNVIQCNDRINDDTLVSMRAKALEGRTSTPLFGGMTSEAAFESACVGWPTLDRNPPHAIDIDFDNTTMPAILMVSNLYDPATPYSWGTKVQQEIGNSHTRRVTRTAAGHTVYFQPEAFDGRTVRAMVS